MYFIIAIIIGLVLLFRSIDRDATWAYRKKLMGDEDDIIINQINEFRRKYEDPAMENELVDYSDEYNRIWRDIKRITTYDNPTPDMVHMIYMAEHGKIPKAAIDKSICIDAGEKKTKKGVIKYNKASRFLVYYNKVLRDHGVDEQLWLITDIPYTKIIETPRGLQEIKPRDTQWILEVCAAEDDFMPYPEISWEFRKHRHLCWRIFKFDSIYI